MEIIFDSFLFLLIMQFRFFVAGLMETPRFGQSRGNPVGSGTRCPQAELIQHKPDHKQSSNPEDHGPKRAGGGAAQGAGKSDPGGLQRDQESENHEQQPDRRQKTDKPEKRFLSEPVHAFACARL